jgi:hypothetical protein
MVPERSVSMRKGYHGVGTVTVEALVDGVPPFVLGSSPFRRHDAVLQQEATLKTSPRQPVGPPAFRKTEYVLVCLRQQMEFRDSMVETSGTARDKSGRHRQRIRAGGRYFDRWS